MSVRTQLISLLFILAAGLACRIAFQAEQYGSPSYLVPVSDAGFNHYWAHASITGDWSSDSHPDAEKLRSLPYIKAPGYLLFLSTVYQALGDHPVVPRIVHTILGLLNILLVFALGRKWFSPLSGLIAAALYSTYWVFIYYENDLHAPTLVVTLTLGILYLLSRVQSRGGALVTGLVFGAGILVRKNLLLFLPAAAWWLYRYRRKEAARFIPTIVTGIILAMAPVTLRNISVSGEWVPISCDAGRNLYMGNHPDADGLHPYLPELEPYTGSSGWNIFSYPTLQGALEDKLGRTLECREIEAYFTQKAWHYIRSEPKAFFKSLLKKGLYFLSPIEVSSDHVVHYDRQASPVLQLLPISYPTVLSLALLGTVALVVARREERFPGWKLGLLFAVLYLVSFLPGIPESRYRVGLIPLMMIAGGFGLDQVLRDLRSRQHMYRGAMMLAGSVLAYAGLRFNVMDYQPNLAKWHYERGYISEQAGHPDLALKHYEKAIAENPTFIEAMNNAGALHANEQAYDQARYYLERAHRLKPGYVQASINLARLFISTGNARDAIDLLEAQPFAHADVYGPLLGTAYTEAGWYDKAEAIFLSELQQRPDRTDLLNGLGVLYLRTDRFFKARKAFEQALEIDPEMPEARRNLLILQGAP